MGKNIAPAMPHWLYRMRLILGCNLLIIMNGSWAFRALGGALCNRIIVHDDDDEDVRAAQSIAAFLLCLPRQQGGDHQQYHIRSDQPLISLVVM